jgi:monoamine oxidase
MEIESQNDEQIVAGAMAVLRRIYGNNIPTPEGWAITRWMSDPFSFGSYSHIPPGASGADYTELSRPVAQRLFFAGEATHRSYPGTVHGAYLSGLRAAKEIEAL